MSVIKRVGAPTRSTKGAVGDVYIDIKARKAYACTSAFRSSTGSVDYVWREKEEEVEEETPVEPDVEEATAQEPQSSDKPPKHNYNKYHKR